MKKNKGYSLVELLIGMVVLVIVLMEVYMVMDNGSKVYSKGSADVALQTEAQQTILQLEDLIIDVNSDIKYTPPVGGISENGTLSISNNDGTVYTISFNGSDPKRAALNYGQLMYTRTDPSGTSGTIPLSDYVSMFYVDTSQIETNTGNTVVLSLKMSNGTYSYSTSKEVFLRNKLGVSSNSYGPSSSGGDYDLTVLRYKEYDLSDMLFEYDGDVCTYFVWEDDTGTSFTTNMADPSNRWSITSNDHLKCNANTNKTWNVSGSTKIWGYKDAAMSTSDPTKHCVILITTDPVGCGLKDANNSVAYMNWYSSSSIAGVCMTQVYGIDVNSALTVDFNMEYANKSTSINASSVEGTNMNILEGEGTPLTKTGIKKLTSDGNPDNASITHCASPIFGYKVWSGQKKVYPDNIAGPDYTLICGDQYIYMDGIQNTFCSYNGSEWISPNCFFDKFNNLGNEKFFGYCVIHFQDGKDLRFPVYGLFVGDAATDSYRDISFKWAGLATH